jgi:hypothetical protein
MSRPFVAGLSLIIWFAVIIPLSAATTHLWPATPEFLTALIKGAISGAGIVFCIFVVPNLVNRKCNTTGQLISQFQNITPIVKAHILAKHLWTSASIDVYLDELCISKTGGQWRLRGVQRSEFYLNDETHTAELSWLPRRGLYFPYQLSIDGHKISDSKVYIYNWPAAFLSPLILIASLILTAYMVTK